MEFCIYWTCSPRARKQVYEVLKIPNEMNINGETFVTTSNEWLISQLYDLQRRGFIKLRNKTKNNPL